MFKLQVDSDVHREWSPAHPSCFKRAQSTLEVQFSITH